MMPSLQITIQRHSLAIRHLTFGSRLRCAQLNPVIPGGRWQRWGLMSLAAFAMALMLLMSENSEAQTGQDLLSFECSNCHGLSAPAFMKRRVYNAAGNAAIITAANAAGMAAPGSPADFNSIATYLDSIKPAITLAPVAFNSPGTVIILPDLSLSSYAIVTGVATVSPPTKGTVTYNFGTSASVTYTPFTGQSGTDTWTYQGSGPVGTTSVRTASVVIAPSAGAQTFVGQMSGSWWDPARSGEGQLINFESSGSRSVVFFAYFTYNASGQASWLVGNVDYQPGATSISIPLITGTGARFGSAFRPTDAQFPSSGTAVLEYVSCTQIRLRYTGSETFTLNLSRLVGPLIGAACPS